jgi:integrase
MLDPTSARTMSLTVDVASPRASPSWESLLPRCASDHLASTFLASLEVRGYQRNTVLAYGRAVEALIAALGQPLDKARLDADAVLVFLAHLRRTPSRKRGRTGACLAASTLRQQVCGLRAFAEHLIARGLLISNPVPLGSVRRTQTGEVIPIRGGLVRAPRFVPRLPTDEQWARMVENLRARSPRDRLMFALAYDGALRRNELMTLRLDDFDFAARQVEIRPECSKNGFGRRVVYSATTGRLLAAYLAQRRSIAVLAPPRQPPFLFLSESPRNRGLPVGGYTWGLLAAALAGECDAPGFTTHTLRHLRLTDLARAGLDIAEIARYAGHRNLGSTMLYIHLSGRDMARAFERASRPHADRLAAL